MTVSFPLTYPTVTGAASATLRKGSVASKSVAPYTRVGQKQIFPGQWWEGEITLPPIKDRETFGVWITFLLKLNGIEGTFLFGDPKGATPLGVGAGTPLVNGAAQSGGSLITDGWMASQTGILKAGDWMQLGTSSSSRLYMNLNDTDSDGSGNATFDIWPDLRGNLIPSDNDAIIVNSAKGLFELATNIQEWDLEPLIYNGITFPIVEAL